MNPSKGSTTKRSSTDAANYATSRWTIPSTRPATRSARSRTAIAHSITEVRLHERVLATLTDRAAPALTSRFGIAEDSAAELRLVVGDNPERIRSEAALAKLCGACPVPASSGKTTRHRLNRGGHRQANAALHRILIVRMRFHGPTIAYVTRRAAEGKTKKEILRCLKRLLIREIYQIIVGPHKRRIPSLRLDNYRSISAVEYQP